MILVGGVLVTVDSRGMIIRRFNIPNVPKPGHYPYKRGDETTYFFKGSSLTPYKVGRFLNVGPLAGRSPATHLQGVTS